ncbi:hypothetical protein ACJ41O_014389 [Fusarium nematophilum]
MRLINTKSLKLRRFTSRPPPYAILSHTWGRQEVSFGDFQNVQRRRRQQGFAKIQSTCLQARRDGLEYAWVDTCCIDQSSSAELGEAINSMFEWYRRSEVCYAYLEDVPPSDMVPRGVPGPLFASSRWFRRGWTLQELLAPSRVRFFDRGWGEIGERKDLLQTLKAVTGIEEDVLNGGSFANISVGRRMSWASQRETTRVEDIAYSLLGIFDVNMPLIYGEAERAFIRLQEEIMKQSEDHSILAWQDTAASAIASPVRGILATSPKMFANFRQKTFNTFQRLEESKPDQIVTFRDYHAPAIPMAFTSRGLRITAVAEDLQPQRPLQLIALGLNCTVDKDLTRVLAVYLKREEGDRYVRVRPSRLTTCASYGPQITIYGLRNWPPFRSGHSQGNNNLPKLAESSNPFSGSDSDFTFHQRSFQYAFFMKDTTTSTSHGVYSVVETYSPKVGDPVGSLERHPVDTLGKNQPLVIRTDWEPHYNYQTLKYAILLRARFGFLESSQRC